MNFNYYYSREADQFTFYRIPKELFKNKFFASLSCEAKVLYGLMLDRMGLSMKNAWLDELNRVYIYFTIEDVNELLGCKKDKSGKLFKELIDFGLIERKRQGQGKASRIYVKSFILKDKEPKSKDKNPDSEKPNESYDATDESNLPVDNLNVAIDSNNSVVDNLILVVDNDEEIVDKPDSGKSAIKENDKNPPSRHRQNSSQDSDKAEVKARTSEKPHSRPPENRNQDSGNIAVKNQTSENPLSRSRENRSQDIGKTAPNKTEERELERNDIESLSINPLTNTGIRPKRADEMDRNPIFENYKAYERLLKKQLDYEVLFGQFGARVDQTIELMLDTICGTRKYININSRPVALEVVKSRLLKLNLFHIQYVYEVFDKTTVDIKNIRAYMLTSLYNAPSTMSDYYRNRVNFDLYGIQEE